MRSESAKSINANGPPQRLQARPHGALLSIKSSSVTDRRISILDSESRCLEEKLPGTKQPSQLPQLVATGRAAEILGRSPATLKRWRYEGIGPDYVEMEGRVRYDLNVLLEFIRKNTRVPSVRAALEEARGVV